MFIESKINSIAINTFIICFRLKKILTKPVIKIKFDNNKYFNIISFSKKLYKVYINLSKKLYKELNFLILIRNNT